MRACLLGAGATLAALSCWGAALPAYAQDNQKAPEVITLPGGLEKFSLPPSNSQQPPAQPRPTPTPSPTPAATRTPAPPPLAPTVRQPAPANTRPAETTPRPAASPTPAATPTPAPVAVPSEAAPVAAPPIDQPDVVAPAPAPSPDIVAPVAEPAPGIPIWLWMLGAAAVLALGAALFLWLRRRPARPEPVAEVPVAAPAPAPVPRAAPPQPRPAPAPPRPAPVAAPVARAVATQSLLVELHPVRVSTRGDEAQIEVEVSVTNQGDQPADEIRVVLGVVSANPEQDRAIRNFFASAPMAQSAPPFTLAPGATHRLSGRLSLFGEAINVVTVGGRTMFVPIVPVNLRWRSGLNVRTFRDAYMVGTEPASGDKLGPFWLDRGARVHERGGARPDEPEGATAAA